MRPGDGSGPAEKTTLAATATRALGWTFFSNALSKLGTVGIGVVLARMLGPHVFGTYAVAWVALLAVLSLNDLSVSLAIVRWPGDPSEIAPTVTTIAVIGSVAVYAVCFFGAPGYASAMGAPAAAGVIRVLALSVVLDGLVCTPVGLLDRSFRQDRRMIADQVNGWLGALVSISLAWAGLGAMSLAVGRITGAVVAAVLYITFSPQPLRFGFDRSAARALLRYGTPLAGSTVVAFAVTNVDQLVVGRVLGATALGFYALALNLATWPVSMFSLPVRNVAPAAFARLQHDHAAMRTAFLSAAALLCAVALPVCLVIGGAATPLIKFAYGARWLPASRVLLWLSLLAALTIFFQLAYDYFVVLARARVVFTVQFGWLLALLPALIVGARLAGIVGVGVAEAAVAGGAILPWYLHELSGAGIRRRVLGARLRLPLAGAVAAGLAAAAAARMLPSDLAALAVSGVAGLAVVGLLVFRMRAALSRLRQGSRETAVPEASKVPALPSGIPLSSAALDARASGPGPWYTPDARASRPGPWHTPDTRASSPGPWHASDVRASGPGPWHTPDTRASSPGPWHASDVRASGPGPWHAPWGADGQDLLGARTDPAGSAGRRPDEARSPALTPALARVMLPPWPAYPDATGPLPIFDSVVKRRYPHSSDQAAPVRWQSATDMWPGDQDSDAAGSSR
jgi:O-antigen/teichoic acid export membrane protein